MLGPHEENNLLKKQGLFSKYLWINQFQKLYFIILFIIQVVHWLI